MNEKLDKLSTSIVNYSLEVKPNDKVLITYQNSECNDLVKCLIKKIHEAKGIAFVKLKDASLEALLLETTTEERIKGIRQENLFEVDNYDCFINIRYLLNDYENKNVTPEIRKKVGEAIKDIDSIRINNRRWVLLNYPSPLGAFKAKQTTSEHFKYAFNVMNIDYNNMYKDIQPLKELMEKTDRVHITGPETDISFSIKNIPVVPCCGKYNIPDGEIYTAPIKESVNGTIKYNTPCPYLGRVYTGVKLTFENGKIVDAICNEDNEALNKIFDTDEGSRYIGEFSLGLNPLILEPAGDILFDEKIIGSIHFTPGRAYENADNGNVSSIHWDMVLVQRKEYGGGEIRFDDVLIRKDGIFVLPQLDHLNYNLK